MKQDRLPKPMNPRNDVLVSVGFIEVSRTPDGFETLRRVSKELERYFRYWEILVIADAGEYDVLSALTETIPNLRLLKVRAGTTMYRKRFVLATQAIGDVLAMTTGGEIESVDLVSMIETSLKEAGIVVSQRKSGNFIDPVIGALGKTTGFHVSTRDMQTVVYPRSLLEMLAARSDKELALRFAPRDTSIKVTKYVISNDKLPERRGLRDTGRRLSIIQKLIVNLAPRVLGYLSILSAFVFVVAFLFVGYIFGVWIFVETIQPGWITTSLVLSGTVAFLGLAVFCLASGIQMVIDLVSPDQGSDVIEERSSVDLFDEVMTELNVDYDPFESEAAEPPAEKVGEFR
jgi:hypothetical protein